MTRLRGGRFTLMLSLLVAVSYFHAAGSRLISNSASETVSVLYAGSLGTVMEHGLGPAFTKATGIGFQGEAQGSLGGAQLIRGRLRTPDVFVSSDPLVNENYLMGPANGGLVKWYMLVASSQIVLGYFPQSRHAREFDAVAAGKMPWYELLEKPGIRFGRGDPAIDPKGFRTIFLFHLAADYYHRPELNTILGDPQNPRQVFPEIVLLARVEAGQFDAGFFYRHEAVARKLKYISFPPEINLGDPRFAAQYAKQTYTTPQGITVHGAPIVFSIMIPVTSLHPVAAVAFVKFVLTSHDLLRKYGFGDVAPQVGGDRAEVPAPLRAFAEGTFQP